MAQQQDPAVSAAVEDYAKAIYALEERGVQAVGTNALAERMGVSAASASAMIRRLGELGLAEHRPYRGVTLTAAGRRIALEVMRHHRLLELYLVQSLGLSWDRVHEEAEVLEHVLSEQLEELIAAQLGNPTRDPHGDPIPSPELELQVNPTRSLQSLEPGMRGRFVRVSDADPEMLRFLSGRGIAPGDELEVIDKQPFDGPLFVRFGSGTHVLGGQLAQAMRVELEPDQRAREAQAAREPGRRASDAQAACEQSEEAR